MSQGNNTITIEDLQAAVKDLATIPYFPSDSRASVMDELADMVPHKEALTWLTKMARARCKQWPGLSELRGLLCTRFDAADGIDEPNCSIPGFTAEEAEARFYQKQFEIRQESKQIAPESRQLIGELATSMQLARRK